MDYYEVLKVPTSATQVDLDRAYQKLIKDARYDNSINRKDIELAYRTLSDATQRALYDATQAERTKRTEATQRTQRIADRKVVKVNRERVLKIAFALLLLIALVYYPIRFGYHLKTFKAGDTLYFKDDARYFGKISRVEDDHDFGIAKSDAYLIQVGSQNQVWWPAEDVKALCFAK